MEKVQSKPKRHQLAVDVYRTKRHKIKNPVELNWIFYFIINF